MCFYVETQSLLIFFRTFEFWTSLRIDDFTDLDLLLNYERFHRTFATGLACRQRTPTPPGTWSRPILDLHVFYLFGPVLFQNRYFSGLCYSNINRYVLDFALCCYFDFFYWVKGLLLKNCIRPVPFSSPFQKVDCYNEYICTCTFSYYLSYRAGTWLTHLLSCFHPDVMWLCYFVCCIHTFIRVRLSK